MEKFCHMKTFISAALEHIKHPSETTTSVLQRNLGVISATIDLSIFDPGSSIAAEFYSILNELMNTLNLKTTLIWNCVDVLQMACKNSVAKQALTHTYKFVPVLSTLLEACSTPEKQERVLKIIEELTFGIKISWQEAYLHFLINTLAQWVMSSKDDKLIALSLGILINLCYKNLPAVYTFMRDVNSKAFTRHLLKMQSLNINTRVQAVKFLIILENMKNEISEKMIMEFVTVSFSSISIALINRDTACLRHVTDFFINLKDNKHFYEILLKYPSYEKDVEQILSDLENSSDIECVGLIMEFLLSLLKFKLAHLVSLYPTLVKVAITWVPVEQVCAKALALIKIILKEIGDEDVDLNLSAPDVVKNIDITVLLVAATVNNEIIEQRKDLSEETIERFAELMQVLQELIKSQSLRMQIVQHFSLKSMQAILSPVFDVKDKWFKEGNFENYLHNSLSSMFVHALSLTADISVYNSHWLEFYNDLLQKKQVHIVLAHALFVGDETVKQKIFCLSSNKTFCKSEVASCMKELEPLLLIHGEITGVINVPQQPPVYHSPLEIDATLSMTQKERLDEIIEKLENAFHSNQISNITFSAIMELYEYKLASMRYSERTMQTSLEAADNRATTLQHRLVQISATSNRLHNLLFYTQQCLEGVQKENECLIQKMHNMEAEIKKVHAEYAKQSTQQRLKYQNEIAAKEAEIEKQREEIRKYATIRDTIFEAFKKTDSMNVNT